jgi:putative hydrolase of the HAD superfamily
MPNILRAVIFDLGGTLMFEREATRPIGAQGDEALTRYLRDQGLELNLSTFPLEFRKRLDTYFNQREKDLYETTYSFVLRDILSSKGYDDVSDDLIRSALDRLFAVTQTNWVLESDALSTLKKIEADGYRMGLISNAGDDKDVQQMVQKFRISRFFDFVLTSAVCSYRKPHPRIFEMTLSNWYFLPSEAVMVGDNLTADVKGAKAAGLFGVWLTRRANSHPEEQADVTPDATISTLAELPSILDRLQVQ